MRRKTKNPTHNLKNSPKSEIVELFFEISRLKQLYRQGWLQRSVPEKECESVAEHIFGVTWLVMLIADLYFPELNSEKVLRLSLIHDLGEIDAGDLTPADGIHQTEKSALERKSVHRIFKNLNNRQRYLDLWEEYEEGKTPEAILVRQVEKLEMAAQAKIYELLGRENLSEFFKSAGNEIRHAKLKELLKAVEEA
jgi:putative hydrolase of HD superfamily